MLYLSDFYWTANFLKYILKEQRKPNEYVKGKKKWASLAEVCAQTSLDLT